MLKTDDQVSDAQGTCLSIVIPCFNEAGGIGRVLDSLLEAFPKSEIIGVNDGSTDETGDVLKEFRERLVVIQHAAYAVDLFFEFENLLGGLRVDVFDGVFQKRKHFFKNFIQLKNPFHRLIGKLEFMHLHLFGDFREILRMISNALQVIDGMYQGRELLRFIRGQVPF